MNTTIKAKHRSKARIKHQMFMEGRIVVPRWIVEVRPDGAWCPLGNKKGIIKHPSKEDAIAAALIANTKLNRTTNRTTEDARS